MTEFKQCLLQLHDQAWGVELRQLHQGVYINSMWRGSQERGRQSNTHDWRRTRGRQLRTRRPRAQDSLERRRYVLELIQDLDRFIAAVRKELELLTVSSPIGNSQERLPRSDHCSDRRRKCRQDQLCQMCPGYEEYAGLPCEQKENVIERISLHCAFDGGRLDPGSIRSEQQNHLAAYRARQICAGHRRGSGST